MAVLADGDGRGLRADTPLAGRSKCPARYRGPLALAGPGVRCWWIDPERVLARSPQGSRTSMGARARRRSSSGPAGACPCSGDPRLLLTQRNSRMRIRLNAPRGAGPRRPRRRIRVGTPKSSRQHAGPPLPSERDGGDAACRRRDDASRPSRRADEIGLPTGMSADTTVEVGMICQNIEDGVTPIRFRSHPPAQRDRHQSADQDTDRVGRAIVEASRTNLCG